MNIPSYNCPTCGQSLNGSMAAQSHMMQCKRRVEEEKKRAADEYERDIREKAAQILMEYEAWLGSPHGRFAVFYARWRAEHPLSYATEHD